MKVITTKSMRYHSGPFIHDRLFTRLLTLYCKYFSPLFVLHKVMQKPFSKFDQIIEQTVMPLHNNQNFFYFYLSCFFFLLALLYVLAKIKISEKTFSSVTSWTMLAGRVHQHLFLAAALFEYLFPLPLPTAVGKWRRQ